MTDRPRIICLITSSLDGGLHPSRYTHSPDGTPEDWSAAYEALHDELGADAWIVGRTTMAEIAKGMPRPRDAGSPPPRPCHLVGAKGPFAMALDRSGKLHFAAPDVGGDPIIVLLGPDVADAHLAELIDDGISYIVAEHAGMTLAPLLQILKREMGIETLLLEGGGGINGSFLAAGVVDEIYLLLTPAVDGSSSRSVIETGGEGLKGKMQLSLLACDRLDSGAVWLRYRVTSAEE